MPLCKDIKKQVDIFLKWILFQKIKSIFSSMYDDDDVYDGYDVYDGMMIDDDDDDWWQWWWWRWWSSS